MDALDDFFGVIATYTVNHDVPTALVVMSRDTRTAQAELLAALWRAGDGSYPIFGDFTCDNNDSYNMTRAAWGKQSTAKYLSACFEEFSPKVVVTHAEDESAPDGAAQFAG
jgi:LmbE family N-acetylglucosaminyl deacetylase